MKKITLDETSVKNQGTVKFVKGTNPENIHTSLQLLSKPAMTKNKQPTHPLPATSTL